MRWEASESREGGVTVGRCHRGLRVERGRCQRGEASEMREGGVRVERRGLSRVERRGHQRLLGRKHRAGHSNPEALPPPPATRGDARVSLGFVVPNHSRKATVPTALPGD